MAGLNLDFSGVPEYQPNNLQICSMGHITDKAIHPIWKGEPMTGTEQQYAPLGYIARNGLGEELMYAAFVGSLAIPATGSPVTIIIPTELYPSSIFTFTSTSATTSLADRKLANGYAFYAYDAVTTTVPRRYGWVRLCLGFGS